MRIAQSTRDADKIKAATTSKGLWDALKEKYGGTTPANTFGVFKSTLQFKIDHNKDPIPQIDELSCLFGILSQYK
ncbi:hypothetical protein H0H81_012744, partial [Sphagnurus paluster]